MDTNVSGYRRVGTIVWAQACMGANVWSLDPVLVRPVLSSEISDENDNIDIYQALINK